MVQTIGESEAERQVIQDIAKYGWHCINIHAEEGYGPFTFTVGLFHTYQHPELIIFGLDGELAHGIFQIAVNAIRQGRAIDLTQPTHELLEGYACCFVEVPRQTYEQHVGFARWFYFGDEFPLYQIVFPSLDGHFPWHPGASDAFRAVQPVLGIPQKAS